MTGPSEKALIVQSTGNYEIVYGDEVSIIGSWSLTYFFARAGVQTIEFAPIESASKDPSVSVFFFHFFSEQY